MPLTPQQQQEQTETLLLEALDLLHEVKKYRGIFYRQKVAQLNEKFNKLKTINHEIPTAGL